MRRALRGFLGGAAIAVQGCTDLAALNHHAVEFADVDGRVKTHGYARARTVPDVADADHGACERMAKVKPGDMLAQLHKRGRRIAGFGVQRVPVAVPELLGQKFQRLCVADGVSGRGQRLSQGFGLRLERVQRREGCHVHIFQIDADFALGACVANRPHKADVS